MFKTFRTVALTLLAVFAPAMIASGEVTPLPKPTERVYDDTGTLSPQTKAFLNQKGQELAAKNGSQLVVYMTNHPVGDKEAMRELTHTSARAWGIGQEGRSNGVVFFIFKAAHKARIEVGTGLEGALPDTRCTTILDTLFVPNAKANNFDEGAKQVSMALISYAGGEQFGEITKKVTDAEKGAGIWVVIILGVIGVLALLWFFGRFLCWPFFEDVAGLVFGLIGALLGGESLGSGGDFSGGGADCDW